jgi:hypothetical protein
MYQDSSVLGLIHQLAPYRGIAVGIFLGMPVLTWTVGLLLKRFSRRACAWFLTFPIHLTVVPGMMMTLLVVYVFFFTDSNLLARYDVVLFFGPILAMGLTFIAARKILPFKEIPGSERLGGLMMIMTLAFIVIFVLARMHFATIFRVSPEILIGIFVSFFIVLEIGMWKISGKRKDDS